MGAPFSRNTNSLAGGSGSIEEAAAAENSSDAVEIVAELSSYETACLQDPELKSFDSTLQRRASHVISTLTSGLDVHSLSFDTLREVTGCLLDTNQEVVKIILEYKKDIWKNAELFNIVEEYFESSLQTLDFCISLEKCLKRARDSHLMILVALKRFEEEEEEEANGDHNWRKKYEKTLEELRHFKAAGDPFTEEFFQAFQSVYNQQVSMLEKLQKKKRKFDKKLKSMKAWRKVSTVIFVSVFTVVLICSVVAAVVSAPPVVSALAAATAAAMGPMGKWLNSLWNEYLVALKGQQEVINTMHIGTYVAILDLDNIKALVDRLEVQIGSLLHNIEFALSDEEAVKFVIVEIKKKLEVFMKSVDELGKQADRCSREMRKARTVVLQRILRPPN